MESNWTELLEKEYGDDPMAMDLAKELKADLGRTDKEIYQFLESFY